MSHKNKAKRLKETRLKLKDTTLTKEAQPYPIIWRGYLIGLLVFFLPFILYLRTLAPTVTFSDSGEFITTAYTLGITHPTGYPTWTMLAHLFTYLPLGNIAWRVNLLSCFFSVLTMLSVYFLMLKLIRSEVLALASSLLLAFSSTLWKISIIAEVYSLYALFAALGLLSLVIWHQQRTKNWLYLTCFIYGLGFTNHLLLIVMGPAVLYFLWITDRKVYLDLRVLGRMTMFFCLGLLPYLYLPIRGFMSPLFDWGNPTTIENFLRLISGKIYKESMFSMSWAETLTSLKYHLGLLSRQFTYFFGWISLIGIWKLSRTNLKLLIFLGLIFLVNAAYGLGLQKVIHGLIDHEAYHLPSYIVLTVLIGYGLFTIWEWLPKLKYAKAAIETVFLLFSLIVCAYHYRPTDMSRYFFAQDYGMNILNQLPQKSILFNQVDYNAFPLWYLQYVENQRRDVPVFTVLFLTRPWFVERLLCLYPQIKVTCSLKEKHTTIFDNIIYNNRQQYQLYFTHDFVTQKADVSPPPLHKEGILNKLSTQAVEGEKFNYNYRGLFDPHISQDVWAHEIMLVYSYYHAELGQRYIMAGLIDKAIDEIKMAIRIDPANASYQAILATAYNTKGDYKQAVKLLEEAIESFPLSVELLYNLGLTYYYQKQYEQAIVSLEKAIQITPQDPNLYNILGLCYHLKGDSHKAVTILQQAMSINPNSVDIKRNLELIMNSRHL